MISAEHISCDSLSASPNPEVFKDVGYFVSFQTPVFVTVIVCPEAVDCS